MSTNPPDDQVYLISALNPPTPCLLQVRDETREVLSISNDGRVTIGEGYDVDSASREFWKVLRQMSPVNIPHDSLRADVYRAVETQFPDDRGQELIQALEQQRNELLNALDEFLRVFQTPAVDDLLDLTGKISMQRLHLLTQMVQTRRAGG